MISLRDGMGSGWDGKFFRRRRRRRRRPGGGDKMEITKSGWSSWKSGEKRGEKKNIKIGEKSENRNLRWGPLDSADGSVLKS